MPIGVIILAAGASSRMGKPKQVLEIEKGKSLLRKAVETALETPLRPVVVVVGAHKREVVPELKGLPVTIIDNAKWEEGLSSSVKMGLAGAYMMDKQLSGVVVLVTDQPAISPVLIEYMVKRYEESGKKAVVCRYADTWGVPALIGPDFFAELTHLTGDSGARQVLEKYEKELDFVDFENGKIDINTPEDYLSYLQTLASEQ